jgi:hypothetical protein
VPIMLNFQPFSVNISPFSSACGAEIDLRTAPSKQGILNMSETHSYFAVDLLTTPPIFLIVSNWKARVLAHSKWNCLKQAPSPSQGPQSVIPATFFVP